jgi:hypothetical protein
MAIDVGCKAIAYNNDFYFSGVIAIHADIWNCNISAVYLQFELTAL